MYKAFPVHLSMYFVSRGFRGAGLVFTVSARLCPLPMQWPKISFGQNRPEGAIYAQGPALMTGAGLNECAFVDLEGNA